MERKVTRKVTGKRWSCLLGLLAGLLVWTSLFPSLAQAQSYEKDKKGSFTLTFRQREEESGVYQGIEGVEMNLYRIGDVLYEKGQISFRLDSAYDSVGLDLTKKNSASKMEEAALEIADLVRANSVSFQTQVSDSEGIIYYPDLAQGVYLLAQNQEESQQESQIQVSPVILTLPYQQEGEWIYEVVSYPKFTTGKQPSVTPTLTPTTTPRLTPTGTPSSKKGSPVDTGDRTEATPWLASLSLAGALGLLLIAAARKKKEQSC